MEYYPYLCFTNQLNKNTMKKFILSLQVITIIGMITSMVVLFNADSNDTIIKSTFIFIGFGCVGIIPILLENKLNKKTTI